MFRIYCQDLYTIVCIVYLALHTDYAFYYLVTHYSTITKSLIDCCRSSGTCSCDSQVTTAAVSSAVVCSVVFYIGGVVSGLLIYLAITRCKETRKQVAITSSGRSEAPNTAAPVYEDIVPTLGREQAGIELQENVAYGPVKK